MYEELKKVNFPILEDRFRKGRTKIKEVEVKNPEEFQLPAQVGHEGMGLELKIEGRSYHAR